MSAASDAPQPQSGRKVALLLLSLCSVLVVAVTLAGPLDDAGHRALFGLMGAASFGFGGGLMWWVQRRRWRAARRASRAR